MAISLSLEGSELRNRISAPSCWMMLPMPGLRSQTLNGPPNGPGLEAAEFFTAARGPERMASARTRCSGVKFSSGISLNRRWSSACVVVFESFMAIPGFGKAQT
jgi:hypothetical protein